MADTPRIENRKARQYYEFLEFFEAGIVLTGPEVKSIRAGQVSFGDSFVECRDGEAFVVGMRIAPYERGGYVLQEPDREKKLLLHSREIHMLATRIEQKGLTVVPVKLYFKQGKVKVEIALARGRKLHDQREELKRRAEARDVERELARYPTEKVWDLPLYEAVINAYLTFVPRCTARHGGKWSSDSVRSALPTGAQWFRRGCWKPWLQVEAPLASLKAASK